jgi:hypothetical protein
MNLRNVTIWTICLTLLLTVATSITIFVICISSPWTEEVSGVGDAIFIAFLIWALSGAPTLIGSHFIAKYLKHNAPLIILLVPTIAYALFYICALFLYPSWDKELAFVGRMTYLLMIPFWFAVVRSNTFHEELSSADPAPSSPAHAKGGKND